LVRVLGQDAQSGHPGHNRGQTGKERQDGKNPTAWTGGSGQDNHDMKPGRGQPKQINLDRSASEVSLEDGKNLTAKSTHSWKKKTGA
jgi:hypothetical protein